MEGDYDVRFYGVYLVETYHYVMHNPKHQALVAVNCQTRPFGYLRFCYEHAEEETGHEMMALHDLINLGLSKDHPGLPEPLAETETFIAYLYWISSHGNPLRRLGYSFWAEDSYQYVAAHLDKVRKVLGLEERQMTFLVSHASIDEKHAAEIDQMLTMNCKSDDDWESSEQVLRTSLLLQSRMLDSIVDEYKKLKAGTSDKYRLLSGLSVHAKPLLQQP
jgi:pyrroloquinoline quinone (PQQ) biosynthesis protein C